MPTEFENVLTNQPVVIDNVGGAVCERNPSLLTCISTFRARG